MLTSQEGEHIAQHRRDDISLVVTVSLFQPGTLINIGCTRSFTLMSALAQAQGHASEHGKVQMEGPAAVKQLLLAESDTALGCAHSVNCTCTD